MCTPTVHARGAAPPRRALRPLPPSTRAPSAHASVHSCVYVTMYTAKFYLCTRRSVSGRWIQYTGCQNADGGLDQPPAHACSKFSTSNMYICTKFSGRIQLPAGRAHAGRERTHHACIQLYRTFTLVFPLTYFPMLISGPDITLRKTPVFHSKLQ